MNSRVLLVNLAGGIKPVTGLKMLPYSLLFVSSYAKKFGVDSIVLDLAASDKWDRDLATYLQGGRFDVVGFTSSPENRFSVWDAIMLTKSAQPGARIIVGGDTFTYTAEQALSSIPEIDFIVRGEGEVTFLELLNRLSRGGAIEDIKGISYQIEGKVVHSPHREAETDIDQLNITDESLGGVVLPKGDYSPFVYLRNYDNKIKALPITIGRGCPNRCVFCLNPRREYRYRRIESVIAEIKDKQRRFNCDAFYMEDPHLVKRASFVRELCNEIIRRNLNIVWWAETRMDIDPSILELMRKAGCISIDFGLESASPNVLSAIRKGIEPGRAEELLKMCHHLGIRVGVFAMVSLPDEEESDALLTIDFLRRNLEYIHQPIYTITKIFPGAELEHIAKQRGCLPADFNWYDRTYSNELPDLVTPGVPVYRDKLSLEFIRRCWGEAQDLQIANKSYGYIVSTYIRGLPRFLLDWRGQGIAGKLDSIARVAKNLLVNFDREARTLKMVAMVMSTMGGLFIAFIIGIGFYFGINFAPNLGFSIFFFVYGAALAVVGLLLAHRTIKIRETRGGN